MFQPCRLVRSLLLSLAVAFPGLARPQSLPLPLPAAGALAAIPATGEVGLDLARADALLMRNNRVLKVSQRAVDVATSEIRRADIGPNPVVSASVQGDQAGRYKAGENDRILRIEQMFERGGKRDLRVALARVGERVARLEFADVRRTQAALMYQAYYELLGQQAALEIARENAAGYDRLVDAAERRLRAGDVAALDVSRIRVEAGRANAEVGAAQAALARAQIALASLLGIESAAMRLRIADGFPSGADGAPVALQPELSPQRVEAATLGRADAAAARERVALFEQARLLAASLRTRDVTLGLQTERAPSLGGSVYGVSASLPLFINNDYSGDLARALSEREQAAEELARVQAAVRSDIDQASAALSAAGARLALLTSAVLPQAQRAAQAIEFAFERGAATLTDLFDARRQYAAVRLDTIVARTDHAKALMAWRQATLLEDFR